MGSVHFVVFVKQLTLVGSVHFVDFVKQLTLVGFVHFVVFVKQLTLVGSVHFMDMNIDPSWSPSTLWTSVVGIRQ